MSLHVLKPGLQTTVQGEPRRGYRHLGIPAAGPADPLSLALANRLLGNPLLANGLEVTLSGATFGADVRTVIAVTGADVDVAVNGEARGMYEAIEVRAGDELRIGGARSGARTYVAVCGGIAGDVVLDSGSTYMPAGLGGHGGRALEFGDELACTASDRAADSRTPEAFRPGREIGAALRVCLVDEAAGGSLCEQQWHVSSRADRMGIQLDGDPINGIDTGRLPSVPVFPGCVQCPPDGAPFLLSVDAQTTGGYARLAQVARADRHVIGQLRTGDSLRFLPRTPGEAIEELRQKIDYWAEWLPGCEAIFY
ncbi:MAG: biotin-dependent carboxyltransferase family protein [Woeseiaceae bacterium]|nr:biotin-dependent carboxyltransferase family protein [Woeseiaceae bacterium]